MIVKSEEPGNAKIAVIDLKYAFLAGLIEGDGSIMLKAHKDAKKRYKATFGMYIKISNTKRELLEFLNENFEGHLSNGYQPKGKNRSVIYEWTVHGREAKFLLMQVYPYLVSKKAQAKLAVEFQTILSLAGKSGSTPCTQEEYEEKARMVQRMHKLNAKGDDKTWLQLDRVAL